jgi:uncharacterized protein
VTAFVDTTALFALLDEDDAYHERAATWFSAAEADQTLLTHNYIVVESVALTQRRLGERFVRTLVDAIIPALSVVFVDPDLHARSLAAYLSGLSNRFSFVDRVSFEFMRGSGVRRAFCFDRDFAREGFETVP